MSAAITHATYTLRQALARLAAVLDALGDCLERSVKQVADDLEGGRP